MIYSRSSIITDCHGKELPEHGLQLFNLSTNDGDIHQFIASCIPAHWHTELEIFILLQGSVQIGIGENTYLLEAGEGCFINTGVLHSFTGTTPSLCAYRSFVFDSSIVGGMPGGVFDTMYIRPLLNEGPPFLKFEKGTDDEPYFRQFDLAFHACVDKQTGYEFQVREALSNILLFTKEKSQLMPSRPIPTVQEARLKEMLEWIEKNMKKTITVRELAGTVNICPRECQRIFSRYLHYSPMEYIRRRRLLAAAELLSSTDIPVTEIALEYGFSSPSYFSKQFKELVGSTPVEYRTAVQRSSVIV